MCMILLPVPLKWDLVFDKGSGLEKLSFIKDPQ